MNMQHVRLMAFGTDTHPTHTHVLPIWALWGPSFFYPASVASWTSIIPRKLGRGKSPPRIIKIFMNIIGP